MEGSVSEDHNDWHTDCPPVVHLRRSQGLLPSSAAATAGDARVTQKETRGTEALTLRSGKAT